jgi:tripartite-type tricarboxylate transporter receptor subunit TctC
VIRALAMDGRRRANLDLRRDNEPHDLETHMKRRSILLAAAASPFAGFAVHAQQASWPTRPVRLIVPWGAGGAADVIARTVGQKLSERWGQPVLVDNKPGANTAIAASEVVRAAPDGYTLFMPLSATLTTNQFMYAKLPYDPMRDFTLITQLVGLPLILLGSANAPSGGLPQLIEQAKSSPDTVTLGVAAGSQLQVERWMRDWGVKFRVVLYKSGIEVTRALLTNEIQMAVDAIPGNLAHIKGGKMMGLAVNTAKRMALVSDVPTLEELNLKNTAPAIWHALAAPAGLPTALQEKIYTDVQAVLATPEVNSRLVNDLGTEVVLGIRPQDLMKKVNTEIAVIGPLVKELGLRAD